MECVPTDVETVEFVTLGLSTTLVAEHRAPGAYKGHRSRLQLSVSTYSDRVEQAHLLSCVEIPFKCSSEALSIAYSAKYLQF